MVAINLQHILNLLYQCQKDGAFYCEFRNTSGCIACFPSMLMLVAEYVVTIPANFRLILCAFARNNFFWPLLHKMATCICALNFKGTNFRNQMQKLLLLTLR